MLWTLGYDTMTRKPLAYRVSWVLYSASFNYSPVWFQFHNIECCVKIKIKKQGVNFNNIFSIFVHYHPVGLLTWHTPNLHAMTSCMTSFTCQPCAATLHDVPSLVYVSIMCSDLVWCEFVAPCRGQPCSHGARCIPRGAGVYSCECSAGYSGQHCDVQGGRNTGIIFKSTRYTWNNRRYRA